MLTLLTPTCNRPKAFELCERWIRRQAINEPYQWIVVDDGEERAGCTLGQTQLLREPGNSPVDSFLGNLSAGLQEAAIRGASKLVFVEDDDWYGPQYIQTMSEWLEDNDIAGESRSRYYNIHTRRYKVNRNTAHCSLCQTGIRGDLISTALEHIGGSKFFDQRLWKVAGSDRYVHATAEHCIGIKGLPGKRGLGYGHRLSSGERADPDGQILKKWIGDDAEVYTGLVESTAA